MRHLSPLFFAAGSGGGELEFPRNEENCTTVSSSREGCRDDCELNIEPF